MSLQTVVSVGGRAWEAGGSLLATRARNFSDSFSPCSSFLCVCVHVRVCVCVCVHHGAISLTHLHF